MAALLEAVNNEGTQQVRVTFRLGGSLSDCTLQHQVVKVARNAGKWKGDLIPEVTFTRLGPCTVEWIALSPPGSPVNNRKRR